MTLLSIVSVVTNTHDTASFHADANDVMSSLGLEYEFIYLNEVGYDTPQAIVADVRATVVTLSRHFAYDTALTAGIDRAQGDVVVTIDIDDSPEVIPQMLDLWRDGFQVVNGGGVARDGLFARAIQRLSGIDIRSDASNIRLLDRKVVDVLATLREDDRHLGDLIAWIGFEQCDLADGVDIRTPEHNALRKSMSASDRPLALASFAGLAACAFALIVVLAMLIQAVAGSASSAEFGLVSVVLFISGVQLLTIGLIGHYAGRTHRASLERPLYVVAEKVNVGDS